MKRYTEVLGEVEWQDGRPDVIATMKEVDNGPYVKVEVAKKMEAVLQKIWDDGAVHDLSEVGEALDFVDNDGESK